MAEGEGFEPPFPGRKAVFKTAALNHSAIPPFFIFLTFYAGSVNPNHGTGRFFLYPSA
jgi:hypothetical protein